MYLAFGPDGYIRYGLDDPMAALASRTASFNEYLHNPPWAAEWIVRPGARASHRRRARAAAAEHEAGAATGRLFIEQALERRRHSRCCRSKPTSWMRARGIPARHAPLVTSFLEARVR